jgi:hypothetical protein
MTENLTTRPRPTRDTRPDIKLSNSKTIKPRIRVATDVGLCEKTVQRMNAATTYVGNVAYVDPDEILKIIASSVKRRNQPAKRRRG